MDFKEKLEKVKKLHVQVFGKIKTDDVHRIELICDEYEWEDLEEAYIAAESYGAYSLFWIINRLRAPEIFKKPHPHKTAVELMEELADKEDRVPDPHCRFCHGTGFVEDPEGDLICECWGPKRSKK